MICEETKNLMEYFGESYKQYLNAENESEKRISESQMVSALNEILTRTGYTISNLKDSYPTYRGIIKDLYADMTTWNGNLLWLYKKDHINTWRPRAKEHKELSDMNKAELMTEFGKIYFNYLNRINGSQYKHSCDMAKIIVELINNEEYDTVLKEYPMCRDIMLEIDKEMYTNDNDDNTLFYGEELVGHLD